MTSGLVTDMTITIPTYEHAVLMFPATPAPYAPAKVKERGLILSPEGLGELDFGVTGVVSNRENPYCTTPYGVCILDNYAGVVSAITTQELEVEYIRKGVRVTEDVEAIFGIDPLRTLLITDSFGADVHGGLTLYSVSIDSNIKDAIYVGVASRMNVKDDFIFRKWSKIGYPAAFARPIVSGREFKLLIYTKGAGDFQIKSITAWLKLTDRRGFNTSPRGAQGDSTTAANTD